MKSFEEHLRGAKAHNREDKIWLVTCFSGKMSLFLANITQDDIGIAMVASVFMLLPVILIFLFGQRYLILGIQSSGVKE